MQRPSSIDKLPPEIRELILRLRNEKGFTFDQIMAKLVELEVVHISRSSVGRWVKRQAPIAERLRRSREITEAIFRETGKEPASKTAQLNIELMHSIVFDLFTVSEDGDPAAIENMKSSPSDMEKLARTVSHLVSAAKGDAEYQKRIRDEIERTVREEAAAGLAETAKERGWDNDTIDAVKARILGVKV